MRRITITPASPAATGAAGTNGAIAPAVRIRLKRMNGAIPTPTRPPRRRRTNAATTTATTGRGTVATRATTALRITTRRGTTGRGTATTRATTMARTIAATRG